MSDSDPPMGAATDRLPSFHIPVRFDGRDADRHIIDMEQLARSMRGLSRIFAVASQFASSHEFVQHRDAMDVRVFVEESRAGCYSFSAVVAVVEASPLLTGVLGTAIPAMAGTLISYIFARNSGKKEEMKHLRAIAEQAIREAGNRDDRIVERMLATIDRLADALRPAARAAVTPVGSSAAELSIGSGPSKTVIGAVEADIIRAETPYEVGREAEFLILITELDMLSGSCRYTDLMSGQPKLKAQITDPVVYLPLNPYVIAMASQKPLNVRAKPSLREGLLEKLYVSTVLDPPS